MAISSAGIGSGLDVESIVSGLMSIERRPLTQVNSDIGDYQSKISAYGTLKSGLSSFQEKVQALSSASKFSAQAVSISDEDVFTATTDGTAVNGNYDITVSQLAKSQKLASNGFSSVADTVGSGTLTISFGSYDSDLNTYTANADKEDIAITIDSSNNTLSGIRDAINAADETVSATIINDGTANRLVITSKDSGTVNSLKITTTDDDGNNTDASGLSQLAFDPTATAGAGKNMLQMQPALDAKLTIDGIDIVKSSNKIDDAISGVTLNLLKTTGTDETIAMGISSDSEKITESVTEFVDAYNELNNNLKNLTKVDAENPENNGELLGDSAVRNMVFKIKSMMTDTIANGSSIDSLTQIGVTFQQDGTLALDSAKLESVIDTNFDDIKKLFAGHAEASDPLISFVGASSSTLEGTYDVTVTKIGNSSSNYEGTINGVGASGSENTLTGAFDDDSEGLELLIGGGALGARGTVTYTQGYAAKLDAFIEDLLDDEGILEAKTDGFNSSIETLESQTERLELRLETIEARYRSQFSRLDTLIASMSTTSSFLSQQLALLA